MKTTFPKHKVFFFARLPANHALTGPVASLDDLNWGVPNTPPISGRVDFPGFLLGASFRSGRIALSRYCMGSARTVSTSVGVPV
jgi:hypothetical protein